MSEVYCTLCRNFHDSTGCPGSPYYNDPSVKREPVKGDIVYALAWPGDEKSSIICGVYMGKVGFGNDRAAVQMEGTDALIHVVLRTITFAYPPGHKGPKVILNTQAFNADQVGTRGIWLDPQLKGGAGLGILLSWDKFKGVNFVVGPFSICLGVRA